MEKILLPIDGSDVCPKAYKHAKKIAEKFNSEIIIFNAQDSTPSFGWLYDPVISKDEKNDPKRTAERIVNAGKKAFDESGINVSTKIAIGDPAAAILDTAEKEDCDLIVMCTHGMSKSKRFLLGSVTNKVVLYSTIPVLVVR